MCDLKKQKSFKEKREKGVEEENGAEALGEKWVLCNFEA
jgi:hypothetical protein